MQYRSPPRPPPAHSMAVSATRPAYACRRWTAEPAGADLEVDRVGWLFGCRRCAAVDELRAGCEQRYATKRCLQLHYLANASSTGPRSGTLRCGAASERGPAWSSKNQAVLTDFIRASRSKLPAARAGRLDSTLRLVRPSLNPCYTRAPARRSSVDQDHPSRSRDLCRGLIRCGSARPRRSCTQAGAAWRRSALRDGAADRSGEQRARRPRGAPAACRIGVARGRPDNGCAPESLRSAGLLPSPRPLLTGDARAVCSFSSSRPRSALSRLGLGARRILAPMARRRSPSVRRRDLPQSTALWALGLRPPCSEDDAARNRRGRGGSRRARHAMGLIPGAQPPRAAHPPPVMASPGLLNGCAGQLAQPLALAMLLQAALLCVRSAPPASVSPRAAAERAGSPGRRGATPGRMPGGGNGPGAGADGAVHGCEQTCASPKRRCISPQPCGAPPGAETAAPNPSYGCTRAPWCPFNAPATPAPTATPIAA